MEEQDSAPKAKCAAAGRASTVLQRARVRAQAKAQAIQDRTKAAAERKAQALLEKAKAKARAIVERASLAAKDRARNTRLSAQAKAKQRGREQAAAIRHRAREKAKMQAKLSLQQAKLRARERASEHAHAIKERAKLKAQEIVDMAFERESRDPAHLLWKRPRNESARSSRRLRPHITPTLLRGSPLYQAALGSQASSSAGFAGTFSEGPLRRATGPSLLLESAGDSTGTSDTMEVVPVSQ